VTAPATLARCDALIVPGQGSFGDCARNLRASGLWEPIQAWIAADRPFLGICVGYQLLFDSSEESPDQPGLGVFAGTVRRFPRTNLKIPHMGWNRLTCQPTDRLYRDLTDPVEVYFVHSYYPEPSDPAIISATCEYGLTFAASVSRGNLSATQYHPEKSQKTGLAILRNFISSIRNPQPKIER
jgi:glutamine amidotransferase